MAGVKLRQVGSVSSVVPGTFFVDEAGRRLYVGSDPSGKQVEASTLQQGLVIQGAGTIVRGIGVRRYGNTFWMGGAISAQVNDIVLENVVSSQNATIGINGWGKKMRFHRITITESGGLGLALNKANDFVLSESVIRGNNSESFKQAPVSGGVKITTSQNVLISANVFE
ncbi:right-handed parallel beta-helix repeat-containing protein, partial [Tessaracoccus antarcticus]